MTSISPGLSATGLFSLPLSGGDVAAIEVLVREGAEVDAPGDLKSTALFEAVIFNHVAAARRLLDLGASPSSRNE